MVRQTSAKRVAARPLAVECRPSMVVKPRKPSKLAALTKGKYEKVPGTRIQALPGGKVVRVVIEDGKKFSPSNARGARLHMAKLARAAEDLARIHGPPQERIKAPQEPKAADKKAVKDPPGAPPRKARLHGSAKRRALRPKDEGREAVSDEWHLGEVVFRSKGFAWVKLLDASGLPEPITQRLVEGSREMMASQAMAEQAPQDAVRPAEHVLRVCYADVVEAAVRLEPGMKLQFKLYMEPRGVGGREVTPVERQKMESG